MRFCQWSCGLEILCLVGLAKSKFQLRYGASGISPHKNYAHGEWKRRKWGLQGMIMRVIRSCCHFILS